MDAQVCMKNFSLENNDDVCNKYMYFSEVEVCSKNFSDDEVLVLLKSAIRILEMLKSGISIFRMLTEHK